MSSVIEISCSEASSSGLSEKKALYICSPSDPNGVFRDTEDLFQQRVIALRNSGFEVDIQRDLDTIEKVANYIAKNYPEGLDYLYFRMHGSSEVGELSELPDGRITTDLTGEAQEGVERICLAVKRGGVLITESCENGKDGSSNLLLYLAKLCHPEVAVIGSRVSNFEVQFHPELPRYHRCVSNGVDQTRMYYQTSSGNVVEISTELFDALYELMGMGPDAMDLCFRLLGEQDISESDEAIGNARELICRNGKDFEVFKEKLRKISIGRDNLSAEWQGYLDHFQKIAKDSLKHPHDLSKLRIDFIDHCGDVEVNYFENEERLGIPSGERPGGSIENAYKFLLGMAVLDRYQSIFSLIDDGDHSATSISARCIFALSGLAIHTTRPSASIRQIMGEYIATVKQSFAEAKTQRMLFHWVDSLIGSSDPCVQAKINGLCEFIAGLWDTDSDMYDEEGDLLDAIADGDIDEIKNFRESLFMKTLTENAFKPEELSELLSEMFNYFRDASEAHQSMTGTNDFRDPILEKRIMALLACHPPTMEFVQQTLLDAFQSDDAAITRCILLLGEIPQDKFDGILRTAVTGNYPKILESVLLFPQAEQVPEMEWRRLAGVAYISGKPDILRILLNRYPFSADQLKAIEKMPCRTMTFAHVQGKALLSAAINKLASDEFLRWVSERINEPQGSASGKEPEQKRRKLEDGEDCV